jgi:hypothetical protein
MGPATLSPERSALDELEFADLWCDDAELLRAEFDAIVAAEWPAPPPIPAPRRPHRYRPGGSPSPMRPCAGRMTTPILGRAERIVTGERERSPP